MGADIVINLVKTVGADRPHELVLARANSIVNQVFTFSVNTAGPVRRGRSIIVDPEGAVLDESPDEAPGVFIHVLDLSHVQRVRDAGTAVTNRMWAQFLPTDRVIDLPLTAAASIPGAGPHSDPSAVEAADSCLPTLSNDKRTCRHCQSLESG
jgi:hypothetical protein